MVSLSDLVAPEPPRTWLEQHQPGDELRFVVIERRDTEVKSGPRVGEGLTWLKVVDEAGQEWEIPLGRTDLKPLVEIHDIDVGDAAVIRYWGLSGRKETYTFKVLHAFEQEELKLPSPVEEGPPLSDSDFAPDEETGA